MRPSLTLLLALSLALPPAGALAQKADSVALKFAWPPGLTIAVTSTKSRTRITEKRTTRSATSRYTLTTEAEGGNLRIHVADPSFETSGDTQLPPAAQAQMLAQVAELMPDYVVSPAGAFIGIHDLPAYQGRLQAFLAKVLPANVDPGMLARMQKLLTSEAFLNAKAAEQWNAVVGTWVGADFEIGARYAHSNNEPVALFPGQQVKMNYTFSAKRLLKCTRGGVERTCAELEMRSSADPEDTKRMIEAFIQSFAGRALPQAPVFRALEIESVLLVVTEPDGLIPHSHSLTRTIRTTVSVGDKEQRGEQVELTQASYAYR